MSEVCRLSSVCSPVSANERTFLGWLSMAVTIGSVSAALVGFTASEEKGDPFSLPPDPVLCMLGLESRKTERPRLCPYHSACCFHQLLHVLPVLLLYSFETTITNGPLGACRELRADHSEHN